MSKVSVNHSIEEKTEIPAPIKVDLATLPKSHFADDQMHQENLNRLQSMTAEEIKEEQEQLKEMFSTE